ncbi:hypothetical protein BvCmsNSNP012_03112 [Escherichia coli]|nr:hypothetical protein BvCmsNSNP012_03112 [Escherichia coli]
MLTPDNVWLAVKPVDMRAGIDTLTQYVQNELNAAWHDGADFVFTNKARSRIKVLRWDKHGVWLCTRRLHRGSFRWPRKGDATWHLTPDEFHWLVCGVDWQQVKGHDLFSVPTGRSPLCDRTNRTLSGCSFVQIVDLNVMIFDQLRSYITGDNTHKKNSPI